MRYGVLTLITVFFALAISGCGFVDFTLTGDSAPAAPGTSETPSPAPEEQKKLIVDSNLTVPYPYLFRSAMYTLDYWGGEIPSEALDYLYQNYLSNQQPGLNTVYIDTGSSSFENYKVLVEQEGLLANAILKAQQIVSRGGQVLFTIIDIPPWLTSAPPSAEKPWLYPPTDYNSWQELVTYITGYLRSQPGIGELSFRIWEEADGTFWYGTDSEFCTLYQHSVSGIHSVDVNAKVTFGNLGIGSPLMKLMINDCPNAPIDFYIYHPFNHAPLTSLYQNDLEVLKSLGANPNTPIHTESWHLMPTVPPLANGESDERDPRRDTEAIAAYAINNLAAQDGAGITYHAFFADVDRFFSRYVGLGLMSKHQQFYGDYGIYTKDLVVKPAYYGFKLLSLLGGFDDKGNSSTLRLPVLNNQSQFIQALASRTEDLTIHRLLLSNYVPTSDQWTFYYRETFRNCLVNKGYSTTDITMIIESLKITYGTKKIDAKGNSDPIAEFLAIVDLTDFPDPNDDQKIKDDIHGCEPEVRATEDSITKATTDPVAVPLILSHLNPGEYHLTSYQVDSEHANACRLNKATENNPSNTPCGIDGVVDQAVSKAKTDAETIAKSQAFDYLIDLGYSTDESLAMLAKVSAILNSCNEQTQRSSTAQQTSNSESVCEKEKIKAYCDSNQKECVDLKATYLYTRTIQNSLFYFGRYQSDSASQAEILTIAVFIDRINQDPTLFLPPEQGGSGLFAKTSEITIPLIGDESRVTIGEDGTFEKSFLMKPNSVHYLELKRR